MFKFFKRVWAYMTASATSKFEERADPKVQLEQAIGEAQDQHRRLTEQAANVIANQKQTEMRLNRAMEELERMNGSTRQALLMVDDAQRRGDTTKAAEYNQAAEGFANRLIAVEKQVEDLKNMHLQTTQAANQAKAAVQQNSSALQKKLAERQKLMSQLDQAKMQEQMNKAMATLSETVGQDVPTFDQVRDKIEARYARAIGQSELQGQTVESRMLEVEQASINTEAQSRLSELRSQLGLGAGDQGALSAPAQQAVPAAGHTGVGADSIPSAQPGDAVRARPDTPGSS
ncbi:MAG: PspA/IM30 family protein [Actinomycetota bacterium]|nr:PspA/IM30 family protein [Actinomycetota bacterium]MDQ6948492.1 PspA/IM30 family protein [Actinomycetota bacterium]